MGNHEEPKQTQNESINKKIISNDFLNNIKSIYIIKLIFKNIKKNKSFELIKYNKKIQKRLNLSLRDYIELSQIVIELIPIKSIHPKFINFIDERKYYHIYFNDEEKEIENNYFTKEDKITKIKICIDHQVTSLKELFYECKCIEKIFFRNFSRNNITNMSHMFSWCSSLKEIDLSNFNTENVTDMSSMFSWCNSLKKLNVSNFKTDKVLYMYDMFAGCSSLKELNLSNFNTKSVIKIDSMFNNCRMLEKLDISNFITYKIPFIFFTFNYCNAFKELKISDLDKNKPLLISIEYNGMKKLNDIILGNNN